MFGWFLKKIYLDHELQEKYVRESNLDWTIVRPSAFTEDKATNNYKVGDELKSANLNLKIAQEDVAAFILKETTSNKFVRQSPGLSN